MGFLNKFKKIFGRDEKEEDNSPPQKEPVDRKETPKKEENILKPQKEHIINAKIDEKSDSTEILYNFKYLDELIKNSTEIVLTSDITLDDSEESDYIDGIEVKNDVIIDGKGHKIDAKGKTRIFKVNSKMTIKNITLKNGFTNIDGGAIRIEDGVLKIENANFIDNESMNSGGALINFGEVIAQYCDFKSNTATKEVGGAILNFGDIHLDACDFIDNFSKKSGGAISVQEGTLNIVGGEYRNNSSDNAGGAIITWGKTNINNCKFIKNNVKVDGGAIVCLDDCFLDISNCEFKENIADGDYGAICNKSKAKLKNCIFTNNVSGENGEDINKHDDDLEMINCQFDDEVNFNQSSESDEFSYDDDSDIICKTEEAIANSLEKFEKLEEKFTKSSLIMINAKNFKYLDDLIHSGKKEIILDSNIVLEKGEELEYREGIELDVDGLTIDGNGHTICPRALTRIFLISADNITIKNTTLAYAFKSTSEGNGIKNAGKGIKLKNCILKHNQSGFGGSIDNLGEMDIENCIFRNNNGHMAADSIRNLGKMNLSSCLIKDDERKSIINYGEMTISESIFKNNPPLENYENINIHKCIFTKHATPLSNNKQMQVSECTLFENNNINLFYSNERGSMEVNDSLILKNDESKISIESGHIKFINCKILHNTNEKGGFIVNRDSLLLYDTSFKNNSSDNLICNNDGEKSTVGIFTSEFKENTVNQSIICNNGKSAHIEHTRFEDNSYSGKNAFLIHNKTELSLGKISQNDNRTILNKGSIFVNEMTDDLERTIDNKKGNIKTGELSDKREYNFDHLNSLVHGDEKEILLDHDICIQEYERNFYEGGIDLDVDNLVIDGNDHSIDGAGISRIFIITGKNITLKNIVFKNGHSSKNYENLFNNDGGAIRNNFTGDLKIENCKFINCKSSRNGAAISNSGKIDIYKCIFSKNESAMFGGAIYNSEGEINILDSEITNHISASGSAFYNLNGKIIASDLTLDNNEIHDDISVIIVKNEYKGIISNKKGQIDISNIDFKGYFIKDKSNYINNDCGNITISKSSFSDFTYYNIGELIYNNEGNIDFNESSIRNIEVEKYAGIIKNNSGKIKITKSSFEDLKFEVGSHMVEKRGKLIDNDSGNVQISKSSFANLKFESDYLIYNEKGKTKIDKTSFKNCDSDGLGDIIKSFSGDIQLSESSFTQNSSTLLYCEGKTTIAKSSFFKNNAYINFIYVEDANILKSTFSENSGRYFEIHGEDKSKIIGCSFLDNAFSLDTNGESEIRDSSFINNNSQSRHLLINNNLQTIFNCSFRENVSEASIINNKDYMKLNESEFRLNQSGKGTILNSGGNLEIDELLFEANHSKIKHSDDINNKGRLMIGKVEFSNDEKTILNDGQAILDDPLSDLDKSIHGEKNVNAFKHLGESQRNFKYLNELISENDKINLDCDIMVDYFEEEMNEFPDGLKLNRDNLTIDGNGHIIDGQGIVRIFEIAGENITLKNIIFENAHDPNNGGAISNISGKNIVIEKCQFNHNFSKSGAAIYNNGEMRVMDSSFSFNIATTASSIYNDKDSVLEVIISCFKSNTATERGSIFGENARLTVDGSIFESNTAADGGAISFNGDLRINECIFKENAVSNRGGAIEFAGGEALITKSKILNNTAKDIGGGIYRRLGNLTHKKCYFRGNKPEGIWK